MLFNCCFGSSLMHELPLPASVVVGGGRCCGRDVLRLAVVGRAAVVVGVLEGLEETLSSVTAITCCFLLMGEAEQSNKLDSSPSSHPPPKSGKSLWKVSSAGALEMSEMPGMICFS